MILVLLAALAALGAPVHVLELPGGVDPGSAEYLVDGIHGAAEAEAAAVVIVLDTPGGLMESAREIVQAELNSEVPVVVWVGPSGARAGSAGVFITAAAHVAAMAPGTHIGAAHPVDLLGGMGRGEQDDGEAPSPDASVMEEKVLQDSLAWSRAIAEQRDRNAEWIQSAVRESASITDSEALELEVVDLVSPDLDALLEEIHGRPVQTPSGTVVLDTAGAERVEVEMTRRQAAMHLLANPTVLLLLIGLGMAGVYAEFQNPGALYPAGVGILCLVAAGVGLSILPFNVAGLLLFVLGFGLFVLETYTPTFGALTAAGVVSLILGGIMLFDVGGLDLGVNPVALVLMALGLGSLTLGLAWLVVRDHRRQPSTGAEGLVGMTGEILTGGEGRGRVRVHGEDWRARWSGEAQPGQRVRVRIVDGLVLEVEILS